MFSTLKNCGFFNGISLLMCRFFSTSAKKGDPERLTKQQDDQYKHIYAQMGISFFDVHACEKAPLSRKYPEHAGEIIAIYSQRKRLLLYSFIINN